MLFNSFIFIMAFLPVCLIGYFSLNRIRRYRTAQAFLLAMSLVFYGYYNPSYVLIIVLSVLVNYGLYKLIRKTAGTNKAKLIMIAGVSFNILLIGYFKYMDFFIGNINSVFKSDIAFLRIALPLGISFFTFQQISFVVDTYRGEVPDYKIIEYACFVTYFPQLIAGPIVTHDELVPQFLDESRKRFNFDNFSKGIYIFALGFGKKILLADIFGIAVEYGFSIPNSLNATESVLTIFAYSLQLYFDFSGYTDMATGVAKMMNIDLPMNFDSPYKSAGISEFWKRWHATLGRFLTRYIYIPLGGNRKGLLRTLLNTMIVFLISGIWHGAAWTFVVWGAMHGLMMVIERLCKKAFDKIPKVIRIIYTYLFVSVAWVIFRADSFSDAFTLIKNVFTKGYYAINDNYLESFRTIELRKVLSIVHLENRFHYITIVGYYVVAFAIVFFTKNSRNKMFSFKPNFVNWMWTLIIMLWGIYSMTGISAFLYFNF